MSKKTMMKAKARVKKAKVKLAAMQRKARREAMRTSAMLKRHQRALMVATRRYKSALKRA